MKGFIRGTFYVLITKVSTKKKYYKHRKLFKERLYLMKGINRENMVDVNDKKLLLFKKRGYLWYDSFFFHKSQKSMDVGS